MPITVESSESVILDLRRELQVLRSELDKRLTAVEMRLAQSQVGTGPSAQRREITPELVVIIAAAVTSFLGKKVKVHSVQRIDSGTSPWAQQGRAFIQASHNLGR